MNLRKETIRLAYQRPDLRSYLLPLLAKTARETNSPTLRKFIAEASAIVGDLLASAPVTGPSREFLIGSVKWLRWGLPSPKQSKWLLNLIDRFEGYLQTKPDHSLTLALSVRAEGDGWREGRMILHKHLSEQEAAGTPIDSSIRYALMARGATSKMSFAQKRKILRLLDESGAIKRMSDLATVMTFLKM